MAGHFHRRRALVRGDDLQIRSRHRGVAIELYARKARKMAQAAGDRSLVLARAYDPRDCLVAVGGLAAAEVDRAVSREGVTVIPIGAGVGGGRMAGDQMIDRQRVLDRAPAALQLAVFLAHTSDPPAPVWR